LSFRPARRTSVVWLNARDLVKPGYVIFIVLYGVERNREWQIGESRVDAVKLVNRHLIFFQIKVGDALLKDSN
jgi:hypothetical protein